MSSGAKDRARWSLAVARIDQIGAHLPELCRSGLVVAALGGPLGFAVGELAARHLLEIGIGSHVD